MSVRVIVVRHGERIDEVDGAEWRKIRTSETKHDPPLTAAGWAQAKLAGRKLASILPQGESHVTIYSSPTARTLSTAAAIIANLRSEAASVTPVYSLNCCAAAQHYGVAEGFPKGEPSADVLRGVPLTCWPPLGDASRVDRLQGTGGGFVNAVKELAATHHDGDVLVLVTHREGIWQVLRHAGGKFKSGYCNISLFSYGLNDQTLGTWDCKSEPVGARAMPPCHAHPEPPEETAASSETVAKVETETLEAVLARGSGRVIVHRNGCGGGRGTLLWCTPGVRGVWADGGAVADGEVVELLGSPVSSEGEQAGFVLVRRSSGVEGWTQVCNVHIQTERNTRSH